MTGAGQNAQGRPSMRSMVSKRDAIPKSRTLVRASRGVGRLPSSTQLIAACASSSLLYEPSLRRPV